MPECIGHGGGEHEQVTMATRCFSVHPALAVALLLSGTGPLVAAGDGPLFSGQKVLMGEQPRSVVVADLNDDGAPDVVSANVDFDDVSVALGLGDGSFEPSTSFDTGDVSVVRGFGDGTFASQERCGTGARIRHGRRGAHRPSRVRRRDRARLPAARRPGVRGGHERGRATGPQPPWPIGLPPGVETIYQVWTQDSGAPSGWAASNALQGVTP